MYFGTGVGIEQTMRAGGADEPVAEIAARRANGHDLHVLAERIVELTIAGGDLALNGLDAQQRFATGECVHAPHQRRKLALDDEILALVHEGLDRAGNAAARAAQNFPPALPGEIRILLRTG